MIAPKSMKYTLGLLAALFLCMPLNGCLQRDKSQAPKLDAKPIPDTAGLRQPRQPQIPATKKKKDTLQPVLAARDWDG